MPQYWGVTACDNMWLLKILVVSVVVCHSQAKFGDLVIQTSSGTVKGWERVSRDGRVYQAWTAIPYAEPPVGPLRFKPPKPKSSWEGVLDAAGDAPPCFQLATTVGSGSEDCLYLNVYRPKIRKENMPVMVHVHGGAFQGLSMGPRENADYLMDEDVVLVALQYRLNAFGFMSLGDSVMPGNFGLKDQVLALKWVKRNIAAFGGNPGSVTVFGESAGAASTHILLKSPATDDLVHRAVSDSGSINKFWSMMKPGSTTHHTLLVAKDCGCPSGNSEDVLKCLQTVDASKIMNSTVATGIDPSVQPFMPVIEPADAEDAVSTFDLSLRPSKKPWMTSVCTGEWLLFRGMMGNKKLPADMRQYMVEYVSALPVSLTKSQIQGAAEILQKFYFSSAGPTGNPVDQLAKVQADMSFLYPVMSNIGMHHGPKWIYRFEHVSEMSRTETARLNLTVEDAPHASQMGAYLNLGRHETSEDYEVSKRMIKYMVNFAHYDDPTPGQAPFKWKQFKETEILRVTKVGDYFADEKTLQEMGDVYSLWDTIIGWENKYLA